MNGGKAERKRRRTFEGLTVNSELTGKRKKRKTERDRKERSELEDIPV